DMLLQRIHTGMVVQRVAQRLRGHNAAVEIRAKWRAFFRQRDLIADQWIDAGQWRKLAARGAAHRDDAVVIRAAAAGEQIFPPELLYRGLFGCELEALVLIREARECGQDRLLAVSIDLMNRKTKAAVEMAIECPSDKGDVVIRKCHHRRHNLIYNC